MAKVKMQIDFTKARHRYVWVGMHNEDDIIGMWKPVEYENIPSNFEYCRHQGHDIDECKSKIRDEDHKKKKGKGR